MSTGNMIVTIVHIFGIDRWLEGWGDYLDLANGRAGCMMGFGGIDEAFGSQHGLFFKFCFDLLV
jgi:hypothetical protein